MGWLRRCLAHAVPPQWDSGGQSRLCFHGVPPMHHHNGWKTFLHLLPQWEVVHNQQETFYLWGLSEDSHRHGSQHGVRHASLTDFALVGQDALGLAPYKLAELAWHCCSSANGICWCSLSKPFTINANHLLHSPLKQLPLGCRAYNQVRYLHSGNHRSSKVDIQPLSLVKTLLYPAGYSQGQKKQMVLGWSRILSGITATACNTFSLFVCTWELREPDLKGHPGRWFYATVLIPACCAVKLYMCWIKINKTSYFHLLLWPVICFSFASLASRTRASSSPGDMADWSTASKTPEITITCWIQCAIQPPPQKGRIIEIQDDHMYHFKTQEGVEMGREWDFLP